MGEGHGGNINSGKKHRGRRGPGEKKLIVVQGDKTGLNQGQERKRGNWKDVNKTQKKAPGTIGSLGRGWGEGGKGDLPDTGGKVGSNWGRNYAAKQRNPVKHPQEKRL